MGAAAAPAAMVGIAANAFGGLMKGEGQQAADQFQAAQLSEEAQIGQASAVETNAQMTQRLTQTLGNIDAVRAAGHDDPSSPTGAAVRNTAQTFGNEQRAIQVGNILQQSEVDQASANYMQQAGSFAMEQGIFGAVAGAAGTIGSTNFQKLFT